MSEECGAISFFVDQIDHSNSSVYGRVYEGNIFIGLEFTFVHLYVITHQPDKHSIKSMSGPVKSEKVKLAVTSIEIFNNRTYHLLDSGRTGRLYLSGEGFDKIDAAAVLATFDTECFATNTD